jgi:hypothetical protein
MSKINRIYNGISPFSLAAIVLLNFLLIYLQVVSLDNQSTILKEIKYNTEVGLNLSEQNQDLLNQVIKIQHQGNETFRKVVALAVNRSAD